MALVTPEFVLTQVFSGEPMGSLAGPARPEPEQRGGEAGGEADRGPPEVRCQELRPRPGPHGAGLRSDAGPEHLAHLSARPNSQLLCRHGRLDHRLGSHQRGRWGFVGLAVLFKSKMAAVGDKRIVSTAGYCETNANLSSQVL